MIHFQRHILKNGLRVLIHEDSSTPLACLNILYDVGARDEEERRTGFAHLFEHLMFGGSVNIPSYDEPLQMAAGENNAYTTNDLTNYYCTLPASNLETAFWLESDRMLSLAFTDKSLEVQRSVVIEEFKQRYLNQPYGDVWLYLRPLAYKTHPYKWATIGKEIAHIETATMEEVRAFFKKFYCPSNAILVVAGNVKEKIVLELCEKWFQPIPAGTATVRNLPQEAEKQEESFLRLNRDVPQDAIYKAYLMCERLHPDYHATDLLSDVLSRGNSSRMYNHLVKEQKVFSEVSSYLMGDLDKGLFVISGKLSDGITTESAENAIDLELESIKAELVSERELQKCKNKSESSLQFSEIDVMNKAANLAYSELMGDPNLVNQESEKYQSVTATDIQRIANAILKKENCATLHYLKSQ